MSEPIIEDQPNKPTLGHGEIKPGKLNPIESRQWPNYPAENTKLKAEITRLKSELEEAKKNEWVSCGERLPEASEETLGREYMAVCAPMDPLHPQKPWTTIRTYGNGHFYDSKVTHWRELPEPPPIFNPEVPPKTSSNNTPSPCSTDSNVGGVGE